MQADEGDESVAPEEWHGMPVKYSTAAAHQRPSLDRTLPCLPPDIDIHIGIWTYPSARRTPWSRSPVHNRASPWNDVEDCLYGYMGELHCRVQIQCNDTSDGCVASVKLVRRFADHVHSCDASAPRHQVRCVFDFSPEYNRVRLSYGFYTLDLYLSPAQDTTALLDVLCVLFTAQGGRYLLISIEGTWVPNYEGCRVPLLILKFFRDERGKQLQRDDDPCSIELIHLSDEDICACMRHLCKPNHSHAYSRTMGKLGIRPRNAKQAEKIVIWCIKFDVFTYSALPINFDIFRSSSSSTLYIDTNWQIRSFKCFFLKYHEPQDLMHYAIEQCAIPLIGDGFEIQATDPQHHLPVNSLL
jgi:hypothetical protein